MNKIRYVLNYSITALEEREDGKVIESYVHSSGAKEIPTHQAVSLKMILESSGFKEAPAVQP